MSKKTAAQWDIEDQVRKIRDPQRDDYTIDINLDLATMRMIRDAVEEVTLGHVETARKVHAMTWQQIGDALGISKQAAHERYAHRIKNYAQQPNFADEIHGPDV
jgi:hypothetical protein